MTLMTLSAATENTFAASNIKIARAQKHLAELTAEIGAFVESRPARFEVEITGPIGLQNVTINFHFERLPPNEFGAIIGDIIHNLRTALDLAACALVRVTEGPAADVTNVYFPFCRRAEELDEMIRRRDFHRAGDQAVALLHRFKPYPGGNDLLRGLHDLDIQDKHKALILAPMSVAGPVMRQWDDDGTPNVTIVGDPTTFSELTLVFPNNGPLPGIEVISTLQTLVELTTGIVESFAELVP
jgi:hypothetical protein